MALAPSATFLNGKDLGVVTAKTARIPAKFEKFLLIDGEANVVGIYDGTNGEEVKRLAADATKLGVDRPAGKAL